MPDPDPCTPQANRLLDRVADRLDPGAVLRGDAVGPAYRRDGDAVEGARPVLVLRPRDTAQVSVILAAATALGQPLVVQGGRTGLSGGARPRQGEVALSMERMTALEPADPLTGTVLAGAGVPIEQVQAAARAAGLAFGVDWGARGTATVGGAIATNAGGIRVLRYGMIRDQVAGLEAVLPDGSVIDTLRGLPKDNAGYDLRHILVGTEGTLGVVTRARLRLRAAPRSETVAVASLPSVGAVLALLPRLRAEMGDLLSAFELLLPEVYAGTLAHLGRRPPVAPGAGAYAMIEAQGADPERDAERFQQALAAATEAGLIEDVVLSASGREFAALWAIRDGVSDFLFAQPDLSGHDIGVPLPAMEAFLARAAGRLAAADPEARVFIFGHVGDGNLHYTVQSRHPQAVAEAVMTAVAEAGGTVAAEHGIGATKVGWLPFARGPAEIAAMARLKRAFDPAGILNPGRVLATPFAHPTSERPSHA